MSSVEYRMSSVDMANTCMPFQYYVWCTYIYIFWCENTHTLTHSHTQTVFAFVITLFNMCRIFPHFRIFNKSLKRATQSWTNKSKCKHTFTTSTATYQRFCDVLQDVIRGREKESELRKKSLAKWSVKTQARESERERESKKEMKTFEVSVKKIMLDKIAWTQP